MMRSGGGGGGLTRHYVLEPLKNLTVLTGVVYLLAGAAAAATAVWFVLHVLGLSIGYVATGAPVLVDSYHQGRCRCLSTWLPIRCRARRRTPLAVGL
jgi:hypothetical protein